jgi:hypothetical protein
MGWQHDAICHRLFQQVRFVRLCFLVYLCERVRRCCSPLWWLPGSSAKWLQEEAANTDSATVLTIRVLDFHSFLGWEDLDVVDPDAEKSNKGNTEKDLGLHEEVRHRTTALCHTCNGLPWFDAVHSLPIWSCRERLHHGRATRSPGSALHTLGMGCPSQERKQAWGTKQFQQYIGMDVTSLLSVPVFIMEPFTILQKV